MTITEFLLARIAEDEDAETAVRQGFAYTERQRRECEAKRRIVAWFGPVNESDDRETYDVVLRALAAVYADHPDYDPTWATE